MSGRLPVAKVTREYLLSLGFRQSPRDPASFTLANLRLEDAARKLGFACSALKAYGGQPPGTDVRTVVLMDRVFVIRAESRDQPHNAPVSLGDPKTICSISVSLDASSLYAPPKPHLTTDGSPHLHITSVNVPHRRDKPIRIAFELATDGKTPLAVSREHITVMLFRGGRMVFMNTATFTEGSPLIVTVAPKKPAALAAGACWNGVADPSRGVASGRWSDLPPGDYVLHVAVTSTAGAKGSGYDYEWLGAATDSRTVCSDEVTVTIPASWSAGG